MKQAYVAISLRKRPIMQAEIDAICDVLESEKIHPFIFVDRYHFTENDAVEMMQTAKKHMDESDLLIAEVSHKAIGVGIEVGYMAAQRKRIIYLRRDGAEYSTTVGGLADFDIVYRDAGNLQKQLQSLFENHPLAQNE